MNINKEYTQVSVRGTDLLLYFLKKWRKILIVSLLGAILLGGYSLIGFISAKGEYVLTDAQRTSKSTQIDDNLAKISSDQELISSLQEQLTSLNDSKDTYQSTLDEALETEYVDTETVMNLIQLNESMMEVEKQINDINQSILNYTNEITTLTEQNTALDLEINETVPTKTALMNIFKKYIIGFLAGMIAAFAYYFVKIFASDKFLNEEEFSARYDSSPLGIVDLSMYRKKRTSKKNSLKSLENNKTQITEIKKKINAETKEDQEILVTGTSDMKVLDMIASFLSRAGFQTVKALSYDTFLNENQNLDQQKIVLVEELFKSDWSSVDKIIEFLNAKDASILGFIVCKN
jgi:hypothetical protein